MRVHGTIGVSANYQENPFIPQQYGVMSANKQTQNRSFNEFLRSQMQSNSQNIDNSAKNQIAGLFLGLQPTLKMQPKLEPTQEDIAM